jgi:hypothetical protein
MSQAVEPGVRSADRSARDRDARDRDVQRGTVDLPDRRLFWRWVWSAVRPVVGWVLAAAGAIALFVGWWGISGQTLTAKQLPYLVSAGLHGIALFIMAGVFLATDDVRRQFDRIGDLERKVDDLYALFAADIASGGTGTGTGVLAPTAPADSAVDRVVALPSGASYHRPDCALVAGKPEARPVDAATLRRRGLAACRVCSPATPAA